MKKRIFEDFDGYDQVVRDIEASRRWGTTYSADVHAAGPYIDRLHPSRIRLRVADVIDETPTAKTFRLVPCEGRLPPFQAGQYIALFFDLDGLRTSRPYSISSPPNQTGHYEITVRRVPDGLISNRLLNDVRRGDVLESSGPRGNFHFNPLFHGNTMVCIAGGSGITPFMSMIREIVECGLARTMLLFHGNRDQEDIIFYDALTRIAARFPGIRYIPVIENPGAGCSGETGLITAERIQRHLIGDSSDRTFYLCGPQGMYDFCMFELEKLGVSRYNVRREVYGPPKAVWEDPAWPRGVGKDDLFRVRPAGGAEFEAAAGEPLLVALERNGVAVPSMCRSGECSMCRIKVVSGRVFLPAGTPVRRSDRRFGYVHSCVAYPLEDLEIVV